VTVKVTFSGVGSFEARVVRTDTQLDLALLFMVGFENQTHTLKYLMLAPECVPHPYLDPLYFALDISKIAFTVLKVSYQTVMICTQSLFQICQIMVPVGDLLWVASSEIFSELSVKTTEWLTTEPH
jgi:hypothetical protein